MIDWTKPLQIEAFGQKSLPCKFVTASLLFGDRNIVETLDGAVYAVCKVTGSLFIHKNFRVTNVKEPWEQAWVNFCNRSDYDTCPYNYDKKEMFRLGYLEGTVK